MHGNHCQYLFSISKNQSLEEGKTLYTTYLAEYDSNIKETIKTPYYLFIMCLVF